MLAQTLNENDSYIISVCGITYTIDAEQHKSYQTIATSTWRINTDICEFPFMFGKNNTVYYLHGYLYGLLNITEINFTFKNGNRTDLRRQNMQIGPHWLDEYMMQNYNVVGYNQGNISTTGSNAGKIINPTWIVRSEDGIIMYVVLVGEQVFIRLDRTFYQAFVDAVSNSGNALNWFYTLKAGKPVILAKDDGKNIYISSKVPGFNNAQNIMFDTDIQSAKIIHQCSRVSEHSVKPYTVAKILVQNNAQNVKRSAIKRSAIKSPVSLKLTPGIKANTLQSSAPNKTSVVIDDEQEFEIEIDNTIEPKSDCRSKSNDEILPTITQNECIQSTSQDSSSNDMNNTTEFEFELEDTSNCDGDDASFDDAKFDYTSVDNSSNASEDIITKTQKQNLPREVIYKCSINITQQIQLDKKTQFNRDLYDPHVCKVHDTIAKYHPILEFIDGHLNKGKLTNPVWKVVDDNDEICYLMYCEPGGICKMCKVSYALVVEHNISLGENRSKWTYHQSGYILNTISKLTMHQIVMNFHGKGKGTTCGSVDHINRIRSDNRLSNLRIATAEEQRANSKGILEGTKRERQYQAQPLPDGITQVMLQRYVVYYKHIDSATGAPIEFFKVEHPLLGKNPWYTTHSRAVSVEDKLKAANNVANDLKLGIMPQSWTEKSKFPKYVRFSMDRNKPHLVYERRYADGQERKSMRMVLPDGVTVDDNLDKHLIKFNAKIVKKYGEDCAIIYIDEENRVVLIK